MRLEIVAVAKYGSLVATSGKLWHRRDRSAPPSTRALVVDAVALQLDIEPVAEQAAPARRSAPPASAGLSAMSASETARPGRR